MFLMANDVGFPVSPGKRRQTQVLQRNLLIHDAEAIEARNGDLNAGTTGFPQPRTFGVEPADKLSIYI